MASRIEAASLRESLTRLELEAMALRTAAADADADAEQLRVRFDARDLETAELAARAAAAEARLTSMKATRRYRVASRLAAPMDRLRTAVGFRP